MNIVLKTGASSLLLRDALRRPLAEIELGEVDASLRKVDGNVTRVCAGQLPWFFLITTLKSYAL